MTFKPILILAFSLFAFSGGEPECGPNQCKDLWTAKKCGAVRHCIAEEWSKIKPTGVRDDVCEICLKMVKEARETLRSNETREELKQVLEGSCALLYFKPAVKVCDMVVDELAPELVDTLSSEMDPEAVCSVAKLCNNEEFWTAHKNSKECVHCQVFTEIAEKDLESVSSEQFRDGILGVCRTAGSFSDACSQIGTEFSGVLHSTAKKIMRSKPCEAVSLCPTNSKTQTDSSQLSIRVRRQMCPLCKTVMGDVREKFLRVRSEEEFSEKMSTACGKMNLSNSTCSTISGPEFYEKLNSSDWLPNLFCSLTFCMEKPEEEVPVWPLLPSHGGSFKSSVDLDVLELLENVEMFFLPVKEEEEKVVKAPRPVISYGDPIENPVFFAPSLYLNDNGDCDTCKEVIDTLSKSKDQDIDSVCNRVQNVDKCKRFVEKFTPVLREAMSRGILSKRLCGRWIPNCQVEQEVSPGTCDFCLNVMKVLKHADSYFWGRALEDKCNELHEKSQEKCKNLSSLFVSFPSLFKNSTKEIEACSNLKLCRPSSVKSENEGEPGKNSCKECMLAVQVFKDTLKSNKSNEYIEELLDSICSLLPHEKKTRCEELVETIGVEGMKKIIESFTPEEVCSKVHMCERRTIAIETPKPTTEVETSDTKVPCKLCLMTIKAVIRELEDSKTEESIRKVVESVCNYLPEETKDTCRNLIDDYEEDIIDMLLADFNATEVCIYLKLCPPRMLFENSFGQGMTVFDIETNELRDWIQGVEEPVLEEFSPRIGIVKLEEPKEEDFHRYRQIVQECALCEAIVGMVSSHRRMLAKDYDFSSHANYICSIVPADKRKACISMAVSYGPSMVNLILDKGVDPNEVCVRLDICDPKMQAKVNEPVSISEDKIVSSDDDCQRGPVFWCANAENAEKCGTFLHCQEMVWKSWKSPPTRTN